jgi:PTS system mannose-specific IID component
MITPWLPLSTRLRMLLRMLTIQGSYNYESMIGTGMAFVMEPALRLLPGGRGGDAYRDAMARQSRYFNAHPYFASVAVGALVRAELSLEPPERIERFRTAACGPLGSVGDRLVWAAWLPLCSLLGLTAFALGMPAWGVVMLFLGIYNAGHLALRVWGLDAGWRNGLSCASALNTPLLRSGPAVVTRMAAFAAGLALPLVLSTTVGLNALGVLVAGSVAALGAWVLFLMHGRIAGWRAAFWLLVASAIGAVVIR